MVLCRRSDSVVTYLYRFHMEKEKNYLIVGTGGVGGSIAGFLALGGKQVTCIARGAQLEAIRQHGLHLKSDLKGEHWLITPEVGFER